MPIPPHTELHLNCVFTRLGWGKLSEMARNGARYPWAPSPTCCTSSDAYVNKTKPGREQFTKPQDSFALSLGPTQGWQEHNPPSPSPLSHHSFPNYIHLTQWDIMENKPLQNILESTQWGGWQTPALSHRWDAEGVKSLQQLCCQSQPRVYP